MISVIIPTYKSPEVLDLCLRSVIEGQANQNQIIVVVDGFIEIHLNTRGERNHGERHQT